MVLPLRYDRKTGDMTKMNERDRAAALLGERISIDKLLTEGVQVNPPLDDEDLNELTTSIGLAGGRLNTMRPLVSARGRLFEGHHRLIIARDRHGRKTITLDEIIVDWSVTDAEAEALAGVRAQNARRKGTGAVRAHQCRYLMSTFGWSQGVVAEKLKVHRPQVSRWLKDFPEAGAEFVIPDVRVGLDGRAIDSVREATVIPTPTRPPEVEAEGEPKPGPPKAKAIRTRSTVASEVVKVTNRYRAELTNPEFNEWLVREHDPAEREALFLAWDAISMATTNIKWSLEPDGWVDGEPPLSASDENDVYWRQVEVDMAAWEAMATPEQRDAFAKFCEEFTAAYTDDGVEMDRDEVEMWDEWDKGYGDAVEPLEAYASRVEAVIDEMEKLTAKMTEDERRGFWRSFEFQDTLDPGERTPESWLETWQRMPDSLRGRFTQPDLPDSLRGHWTQPDEG